MIRSLTPCAAWLLSAGVAAATTVWNPAANGIYPPATGNWNTVGNWTAGLPGYVAPGDKADFNVTGTADCVVTNAQAFTQLVQGDNGNGGVIRVKNGGSLTTSNTWSAVGYNRNAQMIVEPGGEVDCGNHLWIGAYSASVGTLDINGGTVNVAAQFGLGWYGGTGYVNIRTNGILNLTQFSGSQSISGSSVVNLEAGSMIIPGDNSAAVQNYIAAGKITGYGGSGTPVFDYDISHPGETTVQAIPGHISAAWHVVSPQYSTNDLIITPFDAAADFGIVGDGVTDVTAPLQDALILLANLGGGTFFLPAGHYKVSGNLVIPAGVTLRGDWQQPVTGQPVVGTVLMAYAGRGNTNTNAAPFIKLNSSAGVNGLSIWYPEQLPTDIQPYPPTLGNGGGATVENVTFVNAYFGFTSYVNGTTARPFLRNLYGTPLKTGIEFDCLADIGRIDTVHFAPGFWKDSGLPNAPTNNEAAAWIYNNGTGMIVRRIDWSYSCYLTVEGYAIGLALRPGQYDGKYPNGQSYGFNLLGCKTGVYIEASAYAGYQFTRFNIQQAKTGVYLGTSTSEADLFHTCTIDATNDAVFSEGAARVLMMSCDIPRGTLRLNGGYLSVMNSTFAATPANHIELGSQVLGASILGNQFADAPRIIDNTSYPVSINTNPLAVDPLPAYNYTKPTISYRPAHTNLYVVTTAPYNAQADGVSDDTVAFQAALDDAGTNGGGTVFVPGGNYRLNGTLTVPTGVELRGIFDIPHDTKTKGSLLNVYAGRNNGSGTPFLQLQPGAGMKGLNFHYPGQIYNTNDTVNYGMVPYPFLIRGLGADVYVINISATIPYQLLDLATYRCDRHYVDYILSTALRTGIHVGNGAVDGQIQNCQLNPSVYTQASSYYDSIPTGTATGIHTILWRDATPYLFGSMTNEVLHENFVFGGTNGFHLVAEGGHGPSGHCLGFGVDQNTVAMQIDAVGRGGLEPINSQIVSVNSASGAYLQTGASLTNTFRMFGAAGWGTPQYSAVINGGDVRLQLFHVSAAAQAGAFKVLNTAKLADQGGNLGNNLPTGRPFLTIGASTTAAFTGNIINTTTAQMPGNTGNVTSLGNLRVGDSAVSTDRTWNNGGGSRSWNQAANWSGSAVPGIGNRATIGNSAVSGPILSAGTIGSIKDLGIGDLTSTGDEVDLTGGSLTTAEWLILGYGASNAGTLVVSNGVVNVGSDLFVGLHGAGTIKLTGGSITVGGRLEIAPSDSSTGAVLLHGGTLSADSIYLSSGGLLDVAGGGALIINGDATALIADYVSHNWITANGGTNLVLCSYNSGSGKTTITAGAPLPPPAQPVTGISVSGGNVSLTYQTTAGHVYHIEGTPSLAPPAWTPVPGSTNTATGAPVTFVFPAGSGEMFYRTVSP